MVTTYCRLHNTTITETNQNYSRRSPAMIIAAAGATGIATAVTPAATTATTNNNYNRIS